MAKVKVKKKLWQLYILLCEGNCLYTGISPDPEARFEAHQAGRGAAYTRMHKPLRLVYREKLGTLSRALKREAQIKRLSKKEKVEFLQKASAKGFCRF